MMTVPMHTLTALGVAISNRIELTISSGQILRLPDRMGYNEQFTDSAIFGVLRCFLSSKIHRCALFLKK